MNLKITMKLTFQLLIFSVLFMSRGYAQLHLSSKKVRINDSLSVMKNLVIGKEFSTSSNHSLEVLGNAAIDSGRLVFKNTGYSIFIGENAGLSDDLQNRNNVYIGNDAGSANIEGNNNVAIGSEALAANKGSYNFALGTHALQDNINGNDNIGIGNFAGYNSDGNNNIYIGSGAGESVIGTRNIIIGRELATNRILSNALWIDVEKTNTPLIQGSFDSNKSLKINGVFSVSNKMGAGIDTPKSQMDINGTMGLKVKSGLEAGVDNVDESASLWIYTSGTDSITLTAASNVPNRIYTIINKTANSLTISEYKNLLNLSQTTIASGTSLWLVSDGVEWQQIK
jgi:hypothetical protein